MKRYAVHLVSLLSLALAMACLIPQRAVADDDDPPGRVARLGFVRGNVPSSLLEPKIGFPLLSIAP